MYYQRTNLLRVSVDKLDLEYPDLTEADKKKGKTLALPRLETLKIIAPRMGRTLDNPKVVDEYVFALREGYEKIRKSKVKESVPIRQTQTAPSLGMNQMGDTAQGSYEVGHREGLISGAVGTASFAVFSAVFALSCGLYYLYTL